MCQVTVPGEHYQYSNLGFGMLDHVIARASGSTYSEFMREEVFTPLGLTRTSIDIAPGLVIIGIIYRERMFLCINLNVVYILK